MIIETCEVSTQSDDTRIKWENFLILYCFKLTVHNTITTVRAIRKKLFSLDKLFPFLRPVYLSTLISYFFPRQHLKYWNVIREKRSWRQWIDAKGFWDKSYSSNELDSSSQNAHLGKWPQSYWEMEGNLGHFR